MDQRRILESCISHINNAKADIETLNSKSTSSKSKQEFGLAYDALNDCINHCSTGVEHL